MRKHGDRPIYRDYIIERRTISCSSVFFIINKKALSIPKHLIHPKEKNLLPRLPYSNASADPPFV